MAAPGLNCSMQTLSCDTWDRVPRPGIKPGPPVLGAWSRTGPSGKSLPGASLTWAVQEKKTPPFWPLGYEHVSKFTCPRALPSQTPVKTRSLKGFWLPWLSSEQWLLSQLGLGSPKWIWVGVCPGTVPSLVCMWTASLHSLGTHQCMPCDTCSGDPDCLVWVRLLWALRQPLHVWESLQRMEAKSSSLEPSLLSSSSILRVTAPRTPSPSPVGWCCLLVQAAV